MSLHVNDCPHPARNGRHEVYIAKGGGSVCRACGKREPAPLPTAWSDEMRECRSALRELHLSANEGPA